MLVTLTLVFVLAADRSQRREQNPMIEELSLASCLSGHAAQPLAAAWLRSHPGYVLRGWRCGVGTRPERPA